jgi:hypothetical protein
MSKKYWVAMVGNVGGIVMGGKLWMDWLVGWLVGEEVLVDGPA